MSAVKVASWRKGKAKTILGIIFRSKEWLIPESEHLARKEPYRRFRCSDRFEFRRRAGEFIMGPSERNNEWSLQFFSQSFVAAFARSTQSQGKVTLESHQ